MPRGRKTSLMIRLTPAERQTLQAWQRATTIPAGRARRGRIILLLAEGRPISDIAATVGISRRFVYKWAQRFLAQGVEGLADQPGRGSQRVPSPRSCRRSMGTGDPCRAQRARRGRTAAHSSQEWGYISAVDYAILA